MAGPAHRSVSNIRPSIAGVQSPNVGGAPGSPHTPIRAISSNYASPSTLRAEEDYVIIELGSRILRAGFAGDALPKAVIGFGLEQQRRAGDYRKWQVGYDADWRSREREGEWGESRELWRMDLRSLDLGLVGDKIERAVREAFTKYLLIDSRPRRMALVLPSALPLPLLSTILDTLFNNFQSPTISLISAPALTTVAAGLRSGLIIDIGWAETVVTGIYEYREALTRRTIRAGKMLGQEMLKLLATAVISTTNDKGVQLKEMNEKTYRRTVSFEECEEVIARLGWCMPSKSKSRSTSQDQDEGRKSIQASMQTLDINDENVVSIPLNSAVPPVTLRLPLTSLAGPCENAFFADGIKAVEMDDEELPLHLLVYRTLLHLPVDVRSICMSRIIFNGGGSNVPGLKNRVIDEVSSIIKERDWDPVQGVAVEQLRRNEKLRTNARKHANLGPTEVMVGDQVHKGLPRSAAMENQEPDPIEDKIRRDDRKRARPSVHGGLRVVESMGAWSGASLLSQLKIPAVSVVEREQWLQNGAAGASKMGETAPVTQRQSMGPAGLRTGAGDRLSWTLGPWG